MSDDNRSHDRLDLTRLAFAKEGERAHGGLIQDLSPSGAFIKFTYPLGEVEHDFTTNDRIELVLDDETVLFGHVVRAEASGIAVNFDPENAAQEDFLEAMVVAERAAREA